MTAAAKALGFKKVEPWMANLKSKDLHNSALVAVDYQTGELVAYVGSADYYAASTKPAFQPQYDVVGKGYRQPGSAFKPFNYAVGIDDRTITAGTMLMDVGTDFGGGYTPNDADRLERGPVRVRNALQFSLNIPAVKTMALNKPDHVFAKAQEFGMQFQGDADRRAGPRPRRPGGPPGRPRDGLRHARQRRQGDPAHDDPGHQGHQRQGRPAAVRAAGRQAGHQPAGGLHRHRHPGRQHQQERQPVLGQVRDHRARRPPARRRSRPARTTTPRTSTPTATSPRRPMPAARTGAYALAVGVWNGNSDNSLRVDRAVAAVLDRRRDLRLAGLPQRGHRQVARDELQAAGRRPRPGQDRSVHRLRRDVRQERGRRVVHRRHRAAGPRSPQDTCGIDVVAAVDRSRRRSTPG